MHWLPWSVFNWWVANIWLYTTDPIQNHSQRVLYMYQSLEQIKVLEIATTRFDVLRRKAENKYVLMLGTILRCLRIKTVMQIGKRWRPLAGRQTSTAGAEQLLIWRWCEILAGKDYNQNSRWISFSFSYGHICQSWAYHIRSFRRDSRWYFLFLYSFPRARPWCTSLAPWR